MDRGYTPINNKFFEALIAQDLTGADFKVLLLIYRNTIFYHRLEHKISYSYIQNGLNNTLSRPQVVRSVKKLEKLGFIKIKSARGTSPQSIQIRVHNFDKKGTQFWIPSVLNSDNARVIKSDNQHIKEDIKDKQIKEKEKASPIFSLNCITGRMKEMDEETVREYLELLPEELWDMADDDMTEEQIEIYMDWRDSNGLL